MKTIHKQNNMKTTIEIELPELREVKNHKWEIRGYGWESDNKCENAFFETTVNDEWCYSNGKTSGIKRLLYAELVRTHREDGTPLDIPELPKMPDNVERVEYFGENLSNSKMDDSDIYIYTAEGDKEWHSIERVKSSVVDRFPLGKWGTGRLHYARVWYKKETVKKTQLSDLIGEDGQTTSYVIRKCGTVHVFTMFMDEDGWEESELTKGELQNNHRWSHSPFTKFEDANPFIF